MNKLNFFILIIIIIIFSQNTFSQQCNVTLGNDRQICAGTPITLVANGAATYEWSTLQNVPNITVSPTQTTVYIVKGTCTDLTFDYDTISVIVNQLPEISLGNDFAICYGTSIHLEVNGGFQYLWNNGTTNFFLDATPQLTTTYRVTATDLNNCQNSDTVKITVNPLPIVTACPDQEICLHQTAKLTATTGGNNYSWNTGDLNSAIFVTPFITSDYVATVTDINGCKNTDTTKVIVHNLPTANFSYKEVCVDSATLFVNQSFDNENNIINYYWSFGDDSTSVLQTPSHYYLTNGVFDVQLIVVNNVTCRDTISKSVEAFLKPTANFEYNSTNYCNLPVTINFTDKSQNATSYVWNLGNSQISNQQYPQAIYTEAKDFIVSQTVYSEDHCADTMFQTITIDKKPVAKFKTDAQTGCEPFTVTFVNQSDNSNTIKWYIDNQLFYTDTVVYTFNVSTLETGYFNIFMQVENEKCSDSKNEPKYITTYNKPTALFDLNRYISCYKTDEIQIINNSIEASSWKWNFGDTLANVFTSILENPIHKYDTAKVYTITLIAGTEYLCYDTITTKYELDQRPYAMFSTDAQTGCEPFTVTFVNKSKFSDKVKWNIDNQLFNTDTVVYTFNVSTLETGYFDISIQVENEKCSDTTNTPKYITTYNKPTSIFSLNHYSSCYKSDEVRTINNSIEATNWRWNFGDTLTNVYTSILENPIHKYDTADIYTITLIAETENLCYDTATIDYELHQQTYANFNADITKGCENLTVNITNNSYFQTESFFYLDNLMFKKDFITYTFDEGIYGIKLIVKNENCSDTTENLNYITVFNTPKTDFSYEVEAEPFVHGRYYFTNETLDANSYLWNFGDTLYSSELNPEHRYDTYGKFMVTLIATDTISMCTDTAKYLLDVKYFEGLYIPNAFAPSTEFGDASKFLPKGKHLIEYNIQVYNISGKLMWMSNLLEDGQPLEFWDGKFKNVDMPQGIYIWKVYAKFDNNDIWEGQPDKHGIKKTEGTVTLIR